MKGIAAGAALLLAGCAVAPGPSVLPPSATQPERTVWVPATADTGQVRDVAGLEQLALAYPDSGSVRLRLLSAYLAEKDMPALIETLRWLRDRGYVFSEGAREQIPGLVGEGHAEEARMLLLPEAPAIARSEVLATVPSDAGLVESVLMDLDGGVMAVTSVSGKRLWGRIGTSDWRPVELPGAANLSGIVFDPLRMMIWAASGRIDGAQGSAEDFAGLIGVRYPGDTPRLVPAPAGANFSDLHRAADGTIYASDPLGGGIYALRPGEAHTNTVVPPGQLRSPQGLVTNASGALLYVSDYRYGLAVVDLATGETNRLTTELPLLLDGIDGLWRHEGELIAVQNGSSPMRIIALRLGPDGRSISGSRVLEQANRAWTEPLSGYLGGGTLYYVGNGQWDRWVAGEPVQDKPFMPTQIRRLPLD